MKQTNTKRPAIFVTLNDCKLVSCDRKLATCDEKNRCLPYEPPYNTDTLKLAFVHKTYTRTVPCVLRRFVLCSFRERRVALHGNRLSCPRG